ncbi:hypothetical protein N836_19760 [Leptolyngbya sp. Heron Island J]|uniref:hypothetical protein n=1 Tax=Leptolyngbya sp. Heron Island J TaxID=1385935 RepID=UPI0003B9584C|nr:hypothetical protein [Leptolyngbya sp. Heron Island J]ESA33874.1 hypothetical protein N836_19760 [Leptolyngbya sp. Heron Island J]
MWSAFFTAVAILLVTVRVFLTADKQFEVISAGLTATACVMIMIGVSPVVLQMVLLVAIFLMENWLLAQQPKIS